MSKHQRIDIRDLPPISQETLIKHYEIREHELVQHIELLRWKLNALDEWAQGHPRCSPHGRSKRNRRAVAT